MSKRVFLAGASGVIGRRLIPQLLEAGYQVTGMTRSEKSASDLERSGVTVAVVDVFDEGALTRTVTASRPDVIIHQLTDLSLLAGPSDQMATALARNARIRDEGTRNLVIAALAADTTRMIAQSIAWVYAPGKAPHSEDDSLDFDATPPRSTTISGVAALENAVLRTPGLRGAVLRYGHFYGPGTSSDKRTADCAVHVDAAAHAALLALQRDVSGIFNIAEPDGPVATAKAETSLGWDHTYRWREHHRSEGAMK